MEEDIKQFVKHIEQKIENLNKTIERSCWLCGEPVKNWVCIIPENSEQLGLGKASQDKVRIAFIPVCKHHDIDDEENISKIRYLIRIKAQTLRN